VLSPTIANPSCCFRLFRNLEEVEKLSELGVLFLLFEMGLELSIDRLRVSRL
jgi:Kef-type K+ transport system membrane component KefB